MRGRSQRNRFQGLGLLLIVMGLVVPCWPLALTTFGKSSPTNNNNNNNNQNNQNNDNKQPGAVARECRSESECSGIKGASCLEPIDSEDNKMRCLCGDYKPPANGLCDNKYKGVKVMCSNDEECTEGAQCIVGNLTNLPGKRCYCMQGYVEDSDKMCSGSPVAFGFSALSLVASLLLAGNV
ncbi:uncharacterized protein LOC106647755 [Copidosoma floridanum]|uniref:uncharacterized protein LOC106647755 n=1 Tax=Copidosoma floridanum TaxID=29053 RepID=UPI0006C9AC21|nr:uncharacterized protein LOC106647755 [Copidosoma floridanum]